MSSLVPEELPGYRRRILIEPASGSTTSELEDDYHRMVVTLRHDGQGFITGVESQMKRSPWTTCPGAMRQLEQTFLGKPLSYAAAREEKVQNCTHLFDLATFAAGHAGGSAPVAYEVEVSDPVEGQTFARLWRDGVLLYDLAHKDEAFTAPPAMAGLPMKEVGRWIAGEPAERQEAAKILRWAMMVSMGRRIAMPAGMSATKFMSGACFTFQPDVAVIGTRRPGADVDFTAIGSKPLADLEDMFPRHG